MKFVLLIIGIIFLFLGYKMYKSKIDIINTPKSLGSKGGSSLFDKIINNDFEDGS